MNQWKHKVSRTIVLGTFLALVGCVESKIMIVPAAGTFESIPPQYGIVMVRVVDASNTPYPLNHVTLAPRDVYEADENKFFRIRASNEWLGGNTSSTVYVAVVPAATYSLSDLYAFHTFGDSYFANSVSATPAFGTFNVGLNRLTNLGTIIYYPKPDGNHYSDLLVRNESFDDANDYLIEFYPNLGRRLSTADADLTWNVDDYETERQSQYLSVVQNPIAFGSGYLFDDEVVFPAKAGAILRRNQQGIWTLDAVEDDLNLLGFDKNQHGDELVYGEFGTLFIKVSGSMQWTRLKLPTVTGSVTGATVDDSGHIFAYVTHAKSVTLFSAELSGSPQWETVLVYRSDRGWVTPRRDAAIEKGRANYVEETGGRLKGLQRMAQPGFFKVEGRHYFIERNKLFYIDPHQSSGTRIRLGFSITDLAPFRDHLTAIGKQSASGAWKYRTGADLGGKWTNIRRNLDRCPGLKPKLNTIVCPDRPVRKLDLHDHIGVPRFDSPSLGYSILRKNGRSSKKAFRKFLARSQDGGKTWVPMKGHEDFPQYCNQLLPLNDNSKILVGCNGTTGKIFEFDIASSTWLLVREPNTF